MTDAFMKDPTTMNTRRLLIAALGLTLAAGAASAQTTFDQTHPGRAEVNQRLDNQDHRINHERREGELSARRAHRLHRIDRHIRRQERRDARHHHGHVTRAEQHRLNREENRASDHIGN